MRNLRKNRNKADYDLRWQFKKYGIEMLVCQAEIIIEAANKLKK